MAAATPVYLQMQDRQAHDHSHTRSHKTTQPNAMQCASKTCRIIKEQPSGTWIVSAAAVWQATLQPPGLARSREGFIHQVQGQWTLWPVTHTPTHTLSEVAVHGPTLLSMHTMHICIHIVPMIHMPCVLKAIALFIFLDYCCPIEKPKPIFPPSYTCKMG